MQNRPFYSRRTSKRDFQFHGEDVSQCFSRWLYGILSGSMVLMTALAVSSEHAMAQDTNASKVTSSGGYQKLLSKTQEHGTVKVIVKLKTEFTPESLMSTASAGIQRASIAQAQERLVSGLASAGHSPSHSRKFKYVPHIAMTTDREAIDILLASPEVESIEEDIPVPPTLDLSVPRIGATTLHSKGITGKGIAVAVLDTGVDKNHPFLQGSVVSEACYSTTNSDYSSSSVCPGSVNSTATGSALPYGGNCPSGECDHGTHVSGIVAGHSDVSSSPGPGVAPEASIIAIQVFSRFDSTEYCGSSSPCALSFTSDQISGLERVYELRNTYKIASVNMSLGGGKYSSNCDSDSRKSIIDTLKAAGIATVIASGNSGYCGSMGAPACISSAVSVGATDDSDAVANYSNSSSLVSVFAPGSSITSSIPGSGYASWNGTSMATPHVAGSWALIKQANPTATVDQILSSFTSTGLSITDSKCSTVTKQRINVNEAYSTFSPQHQLTVTIGGNKPGTVTADGLTCSGKTCTGTYTGGASITITATYAPKDFVSWSGCSSVSGNSCTVAMSADKAVTAYFSLPPKIKVSPLSINFGSLKADAESSSRTVTIMNAAAIGGADLMLSSLTLSGINALEFGGSTTCSSTPIPRGASCLAHLHATPSSSSFASKSAMLNIYSNDPSNAAVSVKLAAKISPPVLSVSPGSVNFGKIAAGSTSATKIITLKNTGLSDLSVSSITLSGTNASQFTQTNSCSTLAKGATCPVYITATPSAGSFVPISAVLNINSNAPKKGAISVKLSAIVAPPTLSVSPRAVNFGRIVTGTTSTTKTITLKNTGVSDLNISSVTLGGTDSSQFAQTNSCSTLAKGASCGITVSLSPASVGVKNAILTIASNAPRNGTVTVKLTGTGN